MLRQTALKVKSLLIEVPVLRRLVAEPYVWARGLAFRGSSDYWDRRYARGGTSGPGSRGLLAAYKAGFLNEFVRDNGVESVVELGCGDGHQLAMLDAERYLGVDVSPRAVALCRERFADDPSKHFALLADYDPTPTHDLALSLDVVFHLVEDGVYEDYMAALFASSSRYVVVYSSDRDVQDAVQESHVRHRRFSGWVEAHAPGWSVADRVPNPHAFEGDLKSGSFAHFTVFAKG